MASERCADTKDLIALMAASDLRVVIEQSDYDMKDLPELLSRTGASERLFSEAGEFLDPALVWRLLIAVGYNLNDECLGLFEHRVPAGSIELMVTRAMQEPTMGRAISAFADAGKILWPDVKMQFKSRRGELHFSINSSNLRGLPDAAQIFLEISCIPFFCIFQWLAASSISVDRIRIAHGRPENAVHLLAALNCPVQFDGEGVNIVFAGGVADIPTRTRKLREWRTGIYDVLLALLQVRTRSFTSQELQTSVRKALSSGIRPQSAIASSLGMSVATLRRKLMMERTSFRELSDQVFQESVSTLITSGDSVETISSKMGYADARSFRRAFQRVFDMNPSELRKSVQAKQGRLPSSQ